VVTTAVRRWRLVYVVCMETLGIDETLPKRKVSERTANPTRSLMLSYLQIQMLRCAIWQDALRQRTAVDES
jgi:hypothetical protein